MKFSRWAQCVWSLVAAVHAKANQADEADQLLQMKLPKDDLDEGADVPTEIPASHFDEEAPLDESPHNDPEAEAEDIAMNPGEIPEVTPGSKASVGISEEDPRNEPQDEDLIEIVSNFTSSAGGSMPLFIKLQEDNSGYHGINAHLGAGCGATVCGGFGGTAHHWGTRREYNHPKTFIWKLTPGCTPNSYRLEETSHHHGRCLLGMCGYANCGGSAHGVSCSPKGDWRADGSGCEHGGTSHVSDWEFAKVTNRRRSGGSGASFTRFQKPELDQVYVLRNIYHDTFLGVCGHACGANGLYGYPWSNRRWNYPKTLMWKVVNGAASPPKGSWKEICHHIGQPCDESFTWGVTSTKGESWTRTQTAELSITAGFEVAVVKPPVTATKKVEVTATVSESLASTYSTSIARTTSQTSKKYCANVPGKLHTRIFQWITHVWVPGGEDDFVIVNTHKALCMQTTTADPWPRCAGPSCCADALCQTCHAAGTNGC